MTCKLCPRKTRDERTLCDKCEQRLKARLAEIPVLHAESKNNLMPAKNSGYGARSSERTIGININALDYSSARPILAIMHEWERLIREERNLTPPALVRRERNTADEVLSTVRFHLAHFDWIIEQEWIDEYAREIATLYSTGCTAARRDKHADRRIACPAQIKDKICSALITVNADDMFARITCRRCHTEWTTGRLVAVALSTPEQTTWLDAESIASWTNMSERNVRRIVAKNKITKKGQLIDLNEFLEHRDTL